MLALDASRFRYYAPVPALPSGGHGSCALMVGPHTFIRRKVAHEFTRIIGLTISSDTLSATTDRLRIEQNKNGCVINARVGFLLLPLPRDTFAKCGGRRREKRFKISCLREPH